MKRIIAYIIVPFMLSILPVRAQYITSMGSYLEGSNYISTSRIEAFSTKNRFARQASISMDYLCLSETGHSLKKGEYYTIQMNFYERSIGQKILLKCKNGDILELNTNSIQRDPFVQIYWIKEDIVKDIINGEITKVRILTPDGFVDREISSNAFSNAVSRCFTLLKEEKERLKKKNEEFKSFRNGF